VFGKMIAKLQSFLKRTIDRWSYWCYSYCN